MNSEQISNHIDKKKLNLSDNCSEIYSWLLDSQNSRANKIKLVEYLQNKSIEKLKNQKRQIKRLCGCSIHLQKKGSYLISFIDQQIQKQYGALGYKKVIYSITFGLINELFLKCLMNCCGVLIFLFLLVQVLVSAIFISFLINYLSLSIYCTWEQAYQTFNLARFRILAWIFSISQNLIYFSVSVLLSCIGILVDTIISLNIVKHTIRYKKQIKNEASRKEQNSEQRHQSSSQSHSPSISQPNSQPHSQPDRQSRSPSIYQREQQSVSLKIVEENQIAERSVPRARNQN